MNWQAIYSISKALAGDTKPIIRLIGAPYWAVDKFLGNMLQDVVELERMESSWTSAEDIEIIAEGDTYPRPRYIVPSSLLEMYDMAMRIDGSHTGILKYMVDYNSTAEFETSYLTRHSRKINVSSN